MWATRARTTPRCAISKSRIFVTRREGSRWATDPLPGQSEYAESEVTAVDPLQSDDYFMTSTNFLIPSSFYEGGQ